MKLIDLSHVLEPTEAEPVPVDIEYIDHVAGARILGQPAGIDAQAFPDGMGLSLEHVRLTTHSGTHVDAPAHYGPLSAGKPAATIEELPLEWFFAPGICLRCAGTVSDGPVTKKEIIREFARLDAELQPGLIVLIDTGADVHWPSRRYFEDFRGVSREATQYLVEAGIKVIGIDSFGFDPPFAQMLRDYSRLQDTAVLWPAHVYGRERPYCQIERLTNLHQLPRQVGFRVACFPIKIRGAGAGWSRVVAIFDDI